MKKGDWIHVDYDDLAGTVNADSDSATLAENEEFLGFFVRYGSRKGKKVLVAATTKSKDGSLSGWHTFPVAVVNKITAIRRTKK